MSVEEAASSVSEPKVRRKAAVKATAATTTTKKVANAKDASKTKKEKKVSNHPGYLNMIVAALKGLQEKKGSSKAAIVNYILAHFDVGSDKTWLNTKIKLAMKRGLDSKALQQASGSGATGKIRLPIKQSAAKTVVAPKVKKAPKKVVVAKKAPAAKKPATPKAKKAVAPKKAKAPVKPAVAKKSKTVAKKTAAKPKSA